MQLDEARHRAHEAARGSDHSWYVIQVDDDYRVVSQTELNNMPGHAHTIVYGAAPGSQESQKTGVAPA